MITVQMTETEFVREINSVMAQVRQGVQVIVKQDERTVAVLQAPYRGGRDISEVILGLEAGGANAVIDDEFEKDVESGIDAHRELWNPRTWEQS